MDIPKNVCCKIRIIYLIFVLTGFFPARSMLWADVGSAIEILKGSYSADRARENRDVEAIISDLQNALVKCQDDYLIARVKYRIGILYFKTGKINQAGEQFHQLLKEAECPMLIKTASLNMIGQIHRMKGAYEEALKVFDQLAAHFEEQYYSNGQVNVESAIEELWYAALLSRAQIYEAQENDKLSIAEYERVVRLLTKSERENVRVRFPLVYDKMGQLHFRRSNIKKYLALVRSAISDFPHYQRVPLMKLEMECIKFARDNSLNLDLVKKAGNAPVWLIGKITSVENTKVAAFTLTLERLCKESKDSKWGALLQYHYGWLLDRLGEKVRAAHIFAGIGAGSNKKEDDLQTKEVFTMIREYGHIQSAIICGENGEYAQALKILAGLRASPEQSHLGKLAASVRKSIKTLKREVRHNESKK